ncbi:glycosyltransferase family 2 protein [Nesterenkonia alba]|uniref:glycosyltransferase family 2 protein n=1 Tax=Nesterenkonia alba TaxID=515814 RepID=UPI0003B4097D|nr:glycosyltransferase [Nesterenkonia alba]
MPGTEHPAAGQPGPEHSGLDPSAVWVLVCTYQRPELLVELLRSLRKVKLPLNTAGGTELQVPRLVVVDNAPAPQVHTTVEAEYPEAVYLHEPRPGLVHARNTSLDAVPETAEAVIFLDDDERVTTDWFTALLQAHATSGADIITGPVQPRFADGEPPWLSTYGYVRSTDHPEGPYPRRPATNNTLVTAHWFTQEKMRFHPAFNLTGGEDSELFDRLMAAGAQVWWSQAARVSEYVPPERATVDWLRRRARRGGTVRVLKHSLRRRPLTARLRSTAEGAVRIGYGTARILGRRLRGQAVTYTDEYYFYEGLGMLQAVTGRGNEEYARA